MATAPITEKLRLLLVRERELHALRQEFTAYRTWMEKVQTITLRLASHADRGRALTQLVHSLVGDFAFEYAAAIGEGLRVAAGAALEPADEAFLAGAVAAIRLQGGVGATVPEASDDEVPRRLGWLLAAPVYGLEEPGGPGFVLVVGRTPRTAAFYPPPWDREIDRFRHLRDTVAHVIAAVDFRAALTAERNNLRAEVERATAELTTALATAETAKLAAQEASKAKSVFLANMSHELRTPLNAVIGYGELVLEQAEEIGAAEIAADAIRLQAAGRHLAGIIDDVLDLSKIEAKKMDLTLDAFALVPLVTRTLAIVQPLAVQGDNKVVMEVGRDPGEVVADAAKLRQVLVNLLSNACKFTRGGWITVRVDRAGTRERPEVTISVADTGLGMNEAQLAKLFDPYKQLHGPSDGAPTGTGLGLVISRKFCQLMGGDITVTSTPGEGSTFVVRLPQRVAPP